MLAQIRLLMLVLCAVLVAACAPVYGSSDDLPPLPTLIPSPLPQSYRLDGAEDVARRYLDAWSDGDYGTMHTLITFAARDNTPLQPFVELYEAVAGDMTLIDVEYEALTLSRDQPSIAVLTYNVTFETLIVGTFSDTNRTMRLIIDPIDQNWRVAWTPGDIFTEMGLGGSLRLERTIPRRANIYDRKGTVVADQNGRMVTINVVRGEIPNPESCLNSLARALDETPEAVNEILERNGIDWRAEVGVIEPAAYLENQERLERDCDAEFDSFFTRRYPEGTLMPHILGFVGYPTEDEVEAVREIGFNQEAILGRTGIERSWDETLRGRPGGRLSIVDNTEVLRVITDNPPQSAHSVWLTVDADLQREVQRLIEETYALYADGFAPRSRGASAVVLNPQTGAVLAMVSYPTYDANAFVPFPTIGRSAADAIIESMDRNPRNPQLNRVTQGNYPSGSVMKIASTLAVVDSGVYDADERYNCIGSWSREPGFVRSDWLPQGHGLVTVRTGLAQSCNPFFYEVGYQMDQYQPGLLSDYFQRYGLGQPSGITDLAENPGLIPDPEFVRTQYGLNWTFSRSVNIAIGQDLDITPLQIARMTALVANGGIHYKPQLVLRSGLIGEDPSYTFAAEVLDEVEISDEALRVTREGMCDVVQERYGTAEFQFRNQRIAQIPVCGKTGTAQAPGEESAPHAWFTAYAPMENPEVVVTVMVENAGEGSAIAAPIARDILDYYFFELQADPLPFGGIGAG